VLSLSGMVSIQTTVQSIGGAWIYFLPMRKADAFSWCILLESEGVESRKPFVIPGKTRA